MGPITLSPGNRFTAYHPHRTHPGVSQGSLGGSLLFELATPVRRFGARPLHWIPRWCGRVPMTRAWARRIQVLPPSTLVAPLHTFSLWFTVCHLVPFCNWWPYSYSRRRSVSIAALSAGSVTPSSFATCPHRIGRRLDGREVGHVEQASTSRPSTSARCLFAHRWQAIRSVKTFGDMMKTRPDRSQPWKCFSSLMCEM